MKKFESGEIVAFNEIDYIYLCKHPKDKSLSVLELVQHKGRFRILDCVITEQLERKPKTHKVNGFEVPSPLTEEEFRRLDKSGEADTVFCFSSECFDGFSEIPMYSISKIVIKCGFVFKTEDDIKKNILAMQGIDPNSPF
jgi:hypothetical protein